MSGSEWCKAGNESFLSNHHFIPQCQYVQYGKDWGDGTFTSRGPGWETEAPRASGTVPYQRKALSVNADVCMSWCVWFTPFGLCRNVKWRYAGRPWKTREDDGRNWRSGSRRRQTGDKDSWRLRWSSGRNKDLRYLLEEPPHKYLIKADFGHLLSFVSRSRGC